MMNAFFLIAFILIFGYTSGVDVTTKYGVVRGQTVELNTGIKINTYLGIPFAKPPIGDLRWKVCDIGLYACKYNIIAIGIQPCIPILSIIGNMLVK